MPLFVLLFFAIFLEVSVFSLCHTALSIYFNNGNATLILLAESIITGIYAFRVLKKQGLKSFVDLQRASQIGASPESILLTQLTSLISSLLLIIPGILSDIVGLLLLFSPLKKSLFSRFNPSKPNHSSVLYNIFQSSNNWSERTSHQGHKSRQQTSEDVIDVEAEDLSQGHNKNL